MMNQCFIAGTLLQCDDGLKAIERIYPHDWVAARLESDPNAPVEYRRVEQVFIGTARVLELVIAGKVIGTTEQHPFHMKDRGWVPANELSSGDLISTDREDFWVPVEEVRLTDRVEFVYNLRVAQHHTYFVGHEDWTFGLWAHNTYGNNKVAGNT